MPNFTYRCPVGHSHSEFHATIKPPAEVPCGDGCSEMAGRAVVGGNVATGNVSEAALTPVFGLGFGAQNYAIKSDRGAWMKKLDQRVW